MSSEGANASGMRLTNFRRKITVEQILQKLKDKDLIFCNRFILKS